jgi:hypothetical protein
VHSRRGRSGDILHEDAHRSTKDKQMTSRTSRTSRTSPAPTGADLDKTRSRFVFARAQACAHTAAADIRRIESMDRWARVSHDR